MNREQLFQNIKRKRSFLCIGLDSDPSLFPDSVASLKNPIFEFNKAIIDATHQYAVAYKPNLAFYEAEGSPGWEQMEMTVEYIRSVDPSLMIIADAKRGDIGNTADRYAKAFFERMDCDAVTLAPYMGKDSVEPFLKYNGRWSIVLALTSNPSASDFEMEMYKRVIEKGIEWGSPDQLMFVVGATRPEKLAEIRELAPDHFFLVPGVGAQGGTIAQVAAAGMNSKCGLLVNISRNIIFAGKGDDFASVAAKKAAEAAFEMSAYIK
jgi:orotidine-5'-phosphate decarboxylase